jgi:hypothetical protein
VYILSGRASVGHVYVHIYPGTHPAAAKTAPENSAAYADSPVLYSVSCKMAAEGPKKAEAEAEAAAETVATAKAVAAEEEAVVPAPGPPAGDSNSKALVVVVDSE